jgi:hypothetical protein
MPAIVADGRAGNLNVLRFNRVGGCLLSRTFSLVNMLPLRRADEYDAGMGIPSSKLIAVSVDLAVVGVVLLAAPWVAPDSIFMKLAAGA